MQLDNLPPLEPVHPDRFAKWRDDIVTQHLIRDLEIGYFDSVLDPLPVDSIEKIAIESIAREAHRNLADMIFDWMPDGAQPDEEGETDGDE